MAIWHKIGHWWYRMLLNYKTKKIIENERKRAAIIEGFNIRAPLAWRSTKRGRPHVSSISPLVLAYKPVTVR